MKKITSIIFSILICALMALPTFAATNTTSIIDWNKTGTLYIDYKESVEGTEPVPNAEFTAYKIAKIDESGAYVSIIKTISADEIYQSNDDPSNLTDRVKSAYSSNVEDGKTYTTVTNSKGEASIQSMELGLYVVIETKPSAKHFSSSPFYLSLPYTNDNNWVYEIKAEPKSCPAGDLIVAKQVEGDLGETDREFHFMITFKNYTEKVKYIKSNGATGYIQSGNEIILKHGDKVIIENIPVGTEYAVVEKEANTDGYITLASGATGNIKRTVQKVAAFKNTKNGEVNTGDSNWPLICGGISLASFLTAILLYLKKIKKS